MKRKLSVGDKMGRTPRQQGRDRAHSARRGYAYLEDGTPVEIVLNPLGVPAV